MFFLRVAREPTEAPGGSQAMSMAWLPAGAPLLSSHRAVVCKRPGPAHLPERTLASHIGVLRTLEDLRMGNRRSWANAHSPYWSLHVEAWRRSGLSRAEYCARHGLKTKTFARWMKHLVGVEEARRHAEELRELRRKERGRQRKETAQPRPRFGARTDMRSRAVQAFWAMHVEALNWSGMSTGEYANALLLSPWALGKWRGRFDDGEVAIDWRAHLHPSARPRLSTRTSDNTKEPPVESLLTTAPELEPAPPAARPRRNFTDAERHAIVLETERPGVTVSQVARAHGIAPSILFRWRTWLRQGPDRQPGCRADRR